MSPWGFSVPRGAQGVATPVPLPSVPHWVGTVPWHRQGAEVVPCPTSPHRVRSCARHVSPLSLTMCGCVPAARGCPAGGAGRSPGGAVLGLPGAVTSPRCSCGERTSAMSPALLARDGWEELSGLGGLMRLGNGLSLQGKGICKGGLCTGTWNRAGDRWHCCQ